MHETATVPLLVEQPIGLVLDRQAPPAALAEAAARHRERLRALGKPTTLPGWLDWLSDGIRLARLLHPEAVVLQSDAVVRELAEKLAGDDDFSDVEKQQALDWLRAEIVP